MDPDTDLSSLRDSVFGMDAETLEGLIAGDARLTAETPVGAEIRGVLAYKLRHTEEALPLLAIAADAEGHEAHRNSLLFLMRGAFAAGDTETALRRARAVLAREGDPTEALRLIARAHLREKDWEAADEAFAALEARAPDDPETLAQRMRIAGQRGDFTAQIRHADRLLELSPGDAEALRMAFDARVRARRFEGVERILPALAQIDPDGARRRLTPLRGTDQAVVKARTVRNLIAAGFEGGGGPGEPTVADLAADQATMWLNAALRLEASHDDGRAAELLRAVRIVRPDDKDAVEYLEQLADGPIRVLRGAIRGRDEGAIARAAERVLGIDPDVVEAWSALGRAVLKSDPSRAIAAFETACELAPHDPFTRLNLGRALAGAERFAEAVTAFEATIALCGESDGTWREEAERAITSNRRKMIGKARELLREARPREAWVALSASGAAGEAEFASLGTAITRAWLKAVRRRFAELDPDRVGEARAYLETKTADRIVLLLLAREYMGRRQPREALPLWRRLAAIEPTQASHHLQAARCLAAMKAPAEAAEAARAALAIDPGLAEAARLLEPAASDPPPPPTP